MKKSGELLNTLGVLRYRRQEYSLAIDALLQSLPLNKGSNENGHPADLAFLAMSYLKIDNGDEATKYRRMFEESMELDENRSKESEGFENEVILAFSKATD